MGKKEPLQKVVASIDQWPWVTIEQYKHMPVYSYNMKHYSDMIKYSKSVYASKNSASVLKR
jgi:hypothetical protein